MEEALIPQSFTLFPKLPIELRYRIWAEYIKEEEARVVKVQIAVNPPNYALWARELPKYDNQSIRSLTAAPNAFLIHRDCRVEALRYYQRLFSHLEFASPIYFRADKDSVSFTVLNLSKDYRSHPIPFATLRKLAKTDMDSIQRLVMYNGWWKKGFWNISIYPDSRWRIKPGGSFDTQWRYFRGLSELRYVSIHKRDGYAIRRDEVEHCQDTIAEYYRKEKIVHPKCKIPRVTAVPFKDLYEDEDDSGDSDYETASIEPWMISYQIRRG